MEKQATKIANNNNNINIPYICTFITHIIYLFCLFSNLRIWITLVNQIAWHGLIPFSQLHKPTRSQRWFRSKYFSTGNFQIVETSTFEGNKQTNKQHKKTSFGDNSSLEQKF